MIRGLRDGAGRSAPNGDRLDDMGASVAALEQDTVAARRPPYDSGFIQHRYRSQLLGRTSIQAEHEERVVVGRPDPYRLIALRLKRKPAAVGRPYWVHFGANPTEDTLDGL